MIRLLVVAFFIVLNGIVTFGQKPPFKFGDISMDEMQMTSYNKDSSASAVILGDYGQSELDYDQSKGFVLKFERITRIKILKKEGLSWGNFSIYLYHNHTDEEKLSSLKAVTYNLENSKVIETKLGKDGVFRERESEKYDVVKIAFPNTKEGSVVEISYSIISDFIFNFQGWHFQQTIPIVWSEYRARIPEYFHYNKHMQGYISLKIVDETVVPSSITLTTKERSGGTGFSASQTSFSSQKVDFREMRYRWVAEDVPAFKEEPYITTYRDYISRINFELSYTKFPNQGIKNYASTWDDINRLYEESESFGKEISGNGFLKKIVQEIVLGKNSSDEKVAAIHQYVITNFVWDGTTRSYIDGSLKKVFDSKKGNSGELNLLMTSMLNKADIDAHPVLLSTRNHGFLKQNVPDASQFNNVVCLYRNEGKNILLDATEKNLPLGFLPERCLNGKGLLISKEGPIWVELKAPQNSQKVVMVDLTLNPQGEFIGKVNFDKTGYYALSDRNDYNLKGEKDYVNEFRKETNWEITASEFQNVRDLGSPFKEIHSVMISEHVTRGGDMIYFNPLFEWQKTENEFKLEKREYPVDFGSPFREMFIVKINIPEEYDIEEVPESTIFLLPENAGKFQYNVSVLKNIINITTTIQINKSLFSQNEYEYLREFYARIVAKHAEQIVLNQK